MASEASSWLSAIRALTNEVFEIVPCAEPGRVRQTYELVRLMTVEQARYRITSLKGGRPQAKTSSTVLPGSADARARQSAPFAGPLTIL
jgi:hypothetical protein